ncbi:MAG: 3-isopropylmalate dehydratase small subunit [Candidatus Competibacterales bacterium]|nr:3-isopropylmalate dehydratase small subunit [Candidatus Competibacterales bacterium]
MEALQRIVSRTLVLPQTDIDTDQIIPARFLTTTSREGLGDHAFADWRFDDQGRPDPNCRLNAPDAAQARILVAGSNFGCGSSREHAPWALLQFGFRAVVSNRIADIFRHNAETCGLLPVVVEDPEHRWLLEHPGELVKIDIGDQYIELANGHRHRFDLDPFVRHCFREGLDPIGFIEQHASDIEAYEATPA